MTAGNKMVGMGVVAFVFAACGLTFLLVGRTAIGIMMIAVAAVFGIATVAASASPSADDETTSPDADEPGPTSRTLG